MALLRITPGMDPELAIRSSLVQGFYATAAEFPVVSADAGESLTDVKLPSAPPSNHIPEDFVAASESPHEFPDFTRRSQKGLEQLFAHGDFLQDKDSDGLPDSLNFRFDFPETADQALLLAACNLAYRFGMETTGISGPIMLSADWEGPVVAFESRPECGIDWQENAGVPRVVVHGQGQQLLELVNHFCNHFPLMQPGTEVADALESMAESLTMRSADGQLAQLLALANQGQTPEQLFMEPVPPQVLERFETRFPEVEFTSFKAHENVYTREYTPEWEVAVLERYLEDDVFPQLTRGDSIEIRAAVSENQQVRKDLAERISSRCAEQGIELSKIELISSYKQGFSWIEEIVLPQLPSNVDQIEIAFKPFLKQAGDEWLDEDGATPSYQLGGDDPERWFDLPIRYLQELYPIDDVIAASLDINKDQIEFVEYTGERDITYEFRAFADEQAVFNADYRAAYSERPYLDRFPHMGLVHPPTGYLEVWKAGELWKEYHIASDLETIWDIYQQEILPEVEASIRGRQEEPLFSELRLEVWASEPNYDLPIREDMISSLNALHEDMYFVGADYFKQLGQAQRGRAYDAPGLILPVIREAEGAPRIRVQLSQPQAETPKIISAAGKVVPERQVEDITLYLSAIDYTDQSVIGVITTDVAPDLLQAYAELFNTGILEASSIWSGFDQLILQNGSESIRLAIKPVKAPRKDLSINDIDLLEETLIGYEEYMAIMQQLKRVPGISVYPIARSYLGREIYAIELLPKLSGYVSRTKRLATLPSQIINSRHHANEVSSTNSAFILLKKLLTEPEYADLTEDMNLTIVPLENVDGTAIHYELQKDNPRWKLHVARFNAIGKEFYHEHFKRDTIHTEAYGFTRLWQRWLPDIVVDNHGVPSHEWEQPFSGYTAPAFKGFWLPRSLLYGYFWFIKNSEYQSNYALNKQMELVIAQGIARDAEITAWNKEWMEVFEKYAHAWMPKLFPADYFHNMINYWIGFDYDPDHRYPSIRFPWITSVAYTSEVADETAQGEYLNLCARAHVAHDEAVLQLVRQAKHAYAWEQENAPQLKVRFNRLRPMLVE